ncbi:MAG: hypothetical protein ABI856_14575 [Nitrospira sp.]
MTKCRYVAVFAALVFLTVNEATPVFAATSDKDQMNCPGIGEACGKGANGCFSEFTVKNDDKKGSLNVTLPNSVFAVTKPKMNDEAEKKHVIKLRKKVYSISVMPDTVVTEGDTYEFTRCPEALYVRGKKVDPNHK